MLENIFYGYEGGGLHREILQRCVAVKEYPHLQENRVMFPDVMLRDPPAKTSRWLLAVAAAASALMLNRSPGKLEDIGRTEESADDEVRFEERGGGEMGRAANWALERKSAWASEGPANSNYLIKRR